MTLHDHQLQAENERLRERISALEKVLGAATLAPAMLRLSVTERKIFGLITSRDMATKEQLMSVLYAGSMRPDAAILNVYMNRIRKKLTPLGIEIKTDWGNGFYMTAEHRTRITELRQAEQGEA